jgi:hypothetical protein
MKWYERMTAFSEPESFNKELIMAMLKAQSEHLPEGAEYNRDKCMSV